VRRFYANFTYQAGSWTKPRRAIAKVEWHPGELVPRVGFIVTNMSRPAERVVAFYNKRGTCEQMDQGRQRRDQVDAAVVPDVRRKRGAAPASYARLQSRQLPAHAGDARTDQGLVADEPEGEADQNRCKGGEPRPLCRLPDGRGRYPTENVPGDFTANRGTAAAAATRASVRRAMLMCSTATDRRSASECQAKKWPDQTLEHRSACQRVRNGPRLASVLPEGRTSANLTSGREPSGESQPISRALNINKAEQ
jgi:hypothetical protein